uniref:Ig-like domain-containing protein n=1 Tax=Myripristis murdjan TaxID=586833 RepID=A0A667W8C3_9TELE
AYLEHTFIVLCLTDYECPDKPVFHPSRLVVRRDDPADATCLCKSPCDGESSHLEVSLGQTFKQENGTKLLWKVDKMTRWETSPICFYDHEDLKQCCSRLAVTVYQPPDLVSINYLNHTGPLTEGHVYTLQCTVENVAPVGSLSVMFYRGQEALGPSQSRNNSEKKPVTEIFTLNIKPTGEDQEGHYWCEAKLELGPEGPQIPPVEKSQNLTATVHCESHNETNTPQTFETSYNLELNCTAVGNPSPSYAWTLPPANPLLFNASILTINSIAFEDEGKYTCFASNKLGNLTVVFDVDVKSKFNLLSHLQMDEKLKEKAT